MYDRADALGRMGAGAYPAIFTSARKIYSTVWVQVVILTSLLFHLDQRKLCFKALILFKSVENKVGLKG